MEFPSKHENRYRCNAIAAHGSSPVVVAAPSLFCCSLARSHYTEQGPKTKDKVFGFFFIHQELFSSSTKDPSKEEEEPQ